MIGTKKLRRDADGDETLLPLFVMAASILVATVVLMTYTASAIDRNTPTAYWQEETGFDFFGGLEFTYADPTFGYNLTSANFTRHSTSDTVGMKFEFTAADFSYLTVRMVKNYDHPVLDPEQNPTDSLGGENFVCLHVKENEGILHDDKWRAIEFENLFNYWIPSDDGNHTISYGSTRAFGQNISIIITTNVLPLNQSVGNPQADHINCFWMGAYNLKLAFITTPSDDVMGSSMWTILGQIMTLQLPQTGTVADLLLGIPIWAALGFMVFAIARSVIPFLGG
jgi:hypothetical protein